MIVAGKVAGDRDNLRVAAVAVLTPVAAAAGALGHRMPVGTQAVRCVGQGGGCLAARDKRVARVGIVRPADGAIRPCGRNYPGHIRCLIVRVRVNAANLGLDR